MYTWQGGIIYIQKSVYEDLILRGEKNPDKKPKQT